MTGGERGRVTRGEIRRATRGKMREAGMEMDAESCIHAYTTYNANSHTL